MKERMKNPGSILPQATAAIQSLYGTAYKSGFPAKILELAHLRASQINGCSFCVDAGAQSAKKAGETDQRLFSVVAWREAPWFSDAERAALDLTEAVTRIGDRPNPVPDEIWSAAAKYFDEKGMAVLLLMIGVTNLVNRFNVAIRQVAGAKLY